jgi:hypothetical protein
MARARAARLMPSLAAPIVLSSPKLVFVVASPRVSYTAAENSVRSATSTAEATGAIPPWGGKDVREKRLYVDYPPLSAPGRE